MLTVPSYLSTFPHGLMFHHIHNEKCLPAGQGSITDREFEEILHFVGIKNILSPDEWIFKLKNKKLNKSDLCITFDDGIKCQYEICLPILEKYNLRGFWFIYSSVFEGTIEKMEVYRYFTCNYFTSIDDFFNIFFKKCYELGIVVEKDNSFENFHQDYKLKFPFYTLNDIKYRFIRDVMLDKRDYEKIMDELIKERGLSIKDLSTNLWMTNSNLKNLSEKGHFIGLHSYNHPNMISQLSFDEQSDQYKKNYEHIYNVCKKEILSMAHPCGIYNNDTLKILKQLGIVCGFRSNMCPPDGGKINQSTLEIAREDCANILRYALIK